MNGSATLNGGRVYEISLNDHLKSLYSFSFSLFANSFKSRVSIMMKFTKAAAFLVPVGMATVSAQIAAPVDCAKTVGIELVGSLGFTGNLASPVAIGDDLYVIDQSGVIDPNGKGTGGVIYRGSTKVFDFNNLPPGVTWSRTDFNPEYVQNISPGPDSTSLCVTLGSDTLPAGVTLGGAMPAPVVEPTTPALIDANIYDCAQEVNQVLGFPLSQVYYQIIYQFRSNGNKLKKPTPIIAFEAQGGGTHKGKHLARPRQLFLVAAPNSQTHSLTQVALCSLLTMERFYFSPATESRLGVMAVLPRKTTRRIWVRHCSLILSPRPLKWLPRDSAIPSMPSLSIATTHALPLWKLVG